MTTAARKARNNAYLARFAFGIGVAVSITANVIASPKNPVAIGVAVWIPSAFLLTMSLMERIQVKGKAGILRKIGMGFICAIAGWVSYGHLVEVATMGGMDTVSAHLIPLTVDVMMALASPGMRIRQAAPVRRPAAKKAPAKSSPAKLKIAN
jgi:hypothetical protein